jgi:hypothetical protein
MAIQRRNAEVDSPPIHLDEGEYGNRVLLPCECTLASSKARAIADRRPNRSNFECAGGSADRNPHGILDPSSPALLREYTPKFLGISVSLPSQIPRIILTLEAIRAAELPNSPEVLLSGFAVKQGLVPAIPGATRIKDLGTILAKIA